MVKISYTSELRAGGVTGLLSRVTVVMSYGNWCKLCARLAAALRQRFRSPSMVNAVAASAASAHVKWFCAFDVAGQPRGLENVLCPDFELLFGLSVLALMAGCLCRRHARSATPCCARSTARPLRAREYRD